MKVTHHPKDGHPPSKIYQKDVYTRLGIWHLDLTHKIKTSSSWTLKLSFSLSIIYDGCSPNTYWRIYRETNEILKAKDNFQGKRFLAINSSQEIWKWFKRCKRLIWQKYCHNPNNNTTQPQRCSWIGHENDCANDPNKPPHSQKLSGSLN